MLKPPSINWSGEIDFHNDLKNEDFYKSLNYLITILFSIVFGVGLNRITVVVTINEKWLLAVGYIAILLSWWGYNKGVILGPKETNFWSYFIDICLLILYWFILNLTNNFKYELICYTIMFFLYFVWEFVRVLSRSTNEMFFVIRNAMWFNFRMFLYIGFILILNIKCPTDKFLCQIVILLIIIILYRLEINEIYIEKENTMRAKHDILIKAAKQAAELARAPLSKYKVGAAILSSDGKIYTGCNIEFDNYSNTIHAEESAISAMINGASKQIVSIAIFTTGSNPAFPCGMCRQSIYELSNPKTKIIACNNKKQLTISINKLLPFGFKLDNSK